jgi:hypothetical protein
VKIILIPQKILSWSEAIESIWQKNDWGVCVLRKVRYYGTVNMEE